MKSLKNKIQESLRLGLNDSPEMIKPKDWDELRQIIEDRFKEQGPGIKGQSIDFNDIDVSEFYSFFNESINRGLFDSMKYEYIDISEWNTSNLKNISSMFDSCKFLKEVNMCDTSNVKYMQNMFRECKLLKFIPEFDTSNVLNMFGMFTGCESLEFILKFDTSNVEDMSYMFTGCTKLQSISKFNLSKVIDMRSMFYNCNNLDVQTKKIWNPDKLGTPQI